MLRINWLLYASTSIFFLWSSGVTAEIYGVSPQDQAKYSGSTFHCLDAAGSGMPPSVINDDFCDCDDGSDEPGTSACAGQSTTLFYCANTNSVAKMIYSSQVKDGLCDCCDGSDEVGGGCPNVCVEEGKAWFADRDARIQALEQGIKLRDQKALEAQQKRQEWQAEIAKLKAELPDLEKAHTDAQEAQKIPPAIASKFEQLESQIKKMQGEIKALRKRQKDLDNENKKLRQGIAAGSASASTGGAAEGEKKEQPQISEYTKWMDGANDKILENKGDDTAASAEQPPSEEATPEDEGTGDEEDYSEEESSSTASSSSDDPVSQANSKVQDNKRQTRELEEKMGLLPEDKSHHFGLVDKCITLKEVEYEYKFCFFKSANQDHTSLGRWEGWTGPNTAAFKHGSMCPGGPERSLNVIFECGVEEEVTRVGEPSRCVYEAVIKTPGACEPAHLEVEKAEPKPRTPKDEL